ncbi:MAG TPA: ADOP family duplicated permease [Thermoanaerobaculia bacterium]|nr:ADOP family duplicated permease [Thermoanaerobaculia bacterium]
MNGPLPASATPLVLRLARRLRGELAQVVLGDLEEDAARRLARGEPPRSVRRRLARSTWSSLVALAAARAKPQSASNPRTASRRRQKEAAMSRLVEELLVALRGLVRRPLVALAVIATIGVGIGTAATIFSVVEATLMRAPPFADPDRLVVIWNRQQARAESANLLSAADYADVATRSRTLEAVAAVGEAVVAPVDGTDPPVFAREAPATANLFEVLGVRPQVGRLLEPADGVPVEADDAGRYPPEAAVISWDFWQRAFDGDLAVVGRTIRSFRSELTIVGVLPPGFRLVLPDEANMGEDLGAAIDLWPVMRWDFTEADRDGRWFRVVGRRAEGASDAEVRGELSNLAAQLRREHAVHEENGFELTAEPLVAGSTRHVRPLLLLLFSAVATVLLVACVNASGLLLARIAERERELVVRAALGASRGRLIWLSLSETVLLAGAGALLGLGLALGGMHGIRWLRPAGLPHAGDLALNPRVLLFALLLVPLTTLLAGAAPALRALRVRRGGALRSRESTPGRAERRGLGAIVTVQIALTVVLLVGTGLMLRTFVALREQPIGFDPRGVLTADISTVGEVRASEQGRDGLRAWVDRRRLQEHELARRLSELPGVEAASAVFPVPLNGVYARTCGWEVVRDGGDTLSGVAYFRNVWPGYFDAVGMPILAGRDLETRDDQAGAPGWGPREGEGRTDRPVVVVDQRLAERLWPGRDPIGQRIEFATDPRFVHDAEVVGVVPFVRQGGLRDELETIYIPRSYYRSQELTLVIRGEAEPRSLERAVADTVRTVFPSSPLAFGTLDEVVARARGSERFVLTLLACFAAIALALASIGLYGTMALAVRRRTTELGVRMAMGAAPGSIRRLVVGRALTLTLAGAGLGLAVSLGASRLLESLLFQVSPLDPATFGLVALLQIAVGAVACWPPAARAARIDPVAALAED